MTKLVRKMLALFLTLAILLSFAATAFAHDDPLTEEQVDLPEAGQVPEDAASPLATCKHNWVESSKYYVYHAGTYIDTNQCKAVYRTIYRCTLCSSTTQGDLYPTGPHNMTIDTASCTGTVQTWHRSCYNCGRMQTTEQHACPGAPHTGRNCLWLPT